MCVSEIVDETATWANKLVALTLRHVHSINSCALSEAHHASVDSADTESITVSKTELHDLLSKPALEGIPLLVLGNKNDLASSIGVDELIERLELKALANREVCCYSISAKNAVNIDITMDWLIKHSSTSR